MRGTLKKERPEPMQNTKGNIVVYVSLLKYKPLRNAYIWIRFETRYNANRLKISKKNLIFTHKSGEIVM